MTEANFISTFSVTSMQYTMHSTPEMHLETVLVFGPESVSYERSRGICRWVLREISARAFFDIIPTQFGGAYMDIFFQNMDVEVQ